MKQNDATPKKDTSTSYPMQKPFYGKWYFYVILLVLVVVYFFAARETEISFDNMDNLDNVTALLKELFQPKIFEPIVLQQEASLPFIFLNYDPSDKLNTNSLSFYNSSYITLDRYEGNVGDTITLEGGQWPRSSHATLKWITIQPGYTDNLATGEWRSTKILSDTVLIDEMGTFKTQFTIPDIAGRVNLIRFELESREDIDFFKEVYFIARDRLGNNIKIESKSTPGDELVAEVTNTAYDMKAETYTGPMNTPISLHGKGFNKNLTGYLYWMDQEFNRHAVLKYDRYVQTLVGLRKKQIEKLRKTFEAAQMPPQVFSALLPIIDVHPIHDKVEINRLTTVLSNFSEADLGFPTVGSTKNAIQKLIHQYSKELTGTISLSNEQLKEYDLLLTVETNESGDFTTQFNLSENLKPKGIYQQIYVSFTSPVEGFFPYRLSDAALEVLDKIIETIFLALMATSIAVILALPVSFLGAGNLMRGTWLGNATYYVVRSYMNIVRSIEPMILVLITTVWVGVGPFAGVLALAFHGMAALGKLYSEQIEQIDPGPIEAITSTGANKLQVILYGVVPQVVPSFLAFTIYRWDIDIRMSTILGLVGGGGIGHVLIQWIQKGNYQEAGVAIIAIVIVVMIMDFASAEIRRKIV